MLNKKSKPELLSPAGSPEALEAAFLAGADAVYLGGSAFNARINAHNFDDSALREAVAHAHAVGGRVYLTLNTQIYDRELKDALAAADNAASAGVDGLILADMGLSRHIRQALPSLPLHASTQCSGHNKFAGQVLGSMGFCRFVMAREATLADLDTAVRESGLEVEVFVHGALCVSHSGQCLFSSLVGGRSGNRGLCAQPCRLPYRGVGDTATRAKGDAYPLSLKDLSLAQHIPDLIRIGVASLKIEGRMKSPAYVGGVTAIYRRLLDEERGASPDELQALSELFSREGFTDGYFKSSISNRMLGVRTESDKANTHQVSKQAPSGSGAFLPLAMSFSARANTPVTLTLTSPLYRQGHQDNQAVSVTVSADAPLPALNTPTDPAAVSKQLLRLGGTHYTSHDLSCHVEEGLMIPASKLNALRREGIAALEEARLAALREKQQARAARNTLRPKTAHVPPKERSVSYTARFVSETQIPAEAQSFFDVIYLPLEAWKENKNGKPYGVIMPPVSFDREVSDIERCLSLAIEKGATHLMVTNIGQLAMIQSILAEHPQRDIRLHGDFRLNVCNTASAQAHLDLGPESLLLSPELTLPRMRDISAAHPQAAGAIIYGRIPLMLLEKCAIRALYPEGNKNAPFGQAGEACAVCRKNKAELIDRKGVKFPILRCYNHRNVIYNSRPLSMTDKKDALDAAHILERHMIFSVESPSEVQTVIKATQKEIPLSGEVTRIGK